MSKKDNCMSCGMLATLTNQVCMICIIKRRKQVRISIPVTISMVLDKADSVADAVVQVKSICYDDPNIVVAAINETDASKIFFASRY